MGSLFIVKSVFKCKPARLNIIHLVFLIFIVKCFLKEKLWSLLSAFCSPSLLSEIITRSSAYRKWFRGSFCNYIGWQVSLKAPPISSIYRLNNIGLRGHPCFSPKLLFMCLESPLLSFTIYAVLLCIATIFCKNIPLMPNVIKRFVKTSLLTLSYAFLKSMKAVYNFFLSFLTTFSIIVCNKKYDQMY